MISPQTGLKRRSVASFRTSSLHLRPPLWLRRTMAAAKDQGQPSPTPTTTRPTFELERFTWGAPDRLELCGTFAGLRDIPVDAPVLVVSGPETGHRLPVVPGTLSGPPEDGRLWCAEFAWQEPPVAFDVASLEFGAAIVVELPEPDTKNRRFRKQALDVRIAEAEAGTARDEASARPEGELGPGGGTERLRLEAELLVAQEEIRELRAVEEQTRAELARTREDLENVRARHVADAERFRGGLAKVQESAEAALAAEHAAAEQLDSALRQAHEAIEAKDAALGELRKELEASLAARTQAESEARTQAEALRERIVCLECARGAAGEAVTDVERLLRRLTTVRDALGDGR
jgi:hypothetical protein